jgi:hypothetical protein
VTRLYSVNIAHDAARAGEKILKLDDPLAEALAPVLGSLCVFGVRGEEVLDLKVSAIRFTTDLNAEISAVNYEITIPDPPTPELTLTSTPYPVHENDALDATGAGVVLVDLRDLVRDYVKWPAEALENATMDLTGGAMKKITIDYPDYPPEALENATMDLTGGAMKVVVVDYPDYPEESLENATMQLTGGMMTITAYDYKLWPAEEMQNTTMEITGGTMEEE